MDLPTNNQWEEKMTLNKSNKDDFLRAHPKFGQLMSYGLIDKCQALLTMLVYLDLTEGKCWWNVAFVPSERLHTVLLSGQSQQWDEPELMMPLAACKAVSVDGLQKMLANVGSEHASKSLSLALVDADSSLVYYRLTSGLQPPPPPEWLEEKQLRREQQFQRQRKQWIPHSAAVNQTEDKTLQSSDGTPSTSSS